MIFNVQENSNIAHVARGERIVVDNSAEAGVREFKIDGKTEQVTTSGKNICSGYKMGAYSNSNGSYMSTQSYQCSELIEVVENVDYIESNGLSCVITDIHYFDETKTWLGRVQKPQNINNRPEGTKYIGFNYEITEDLKWVQVEKGTVTTAYEPYTNGASPNPEYPQDINGVGDSGEVEVTVTGKNLLKGLVYKIVNGVTFNVYDDGRVVVKGTATANAFIDTRLTFPAGNYVLSGCPSGGSGSSYSLELAYSGKWLYDHGNGLNFSLSEDTSCKIAVLVRKGQTVNNITFYPMLREAEIGDDTFELYKSQKAKFPLYPPLYEGDYVKIKSRTFEIVRNNDKVVFDGSDDEGWKFETTTNGSNRAYTDIIKNTVNIPSNNDTIANIFCNRFISESANDTWRGKEGIGIQADGRIYIVHSKITSLAEWKAYLAENPITAVYKLAEPNTANIEMDIDLSTYCNVTHFTNADNANMEVEYFGNSPNGKVVGELQEQVNSYVVVEKFDFTDRENPIPVNERYDLYLPVNKYGYIPIMATVNFNIDPVPVSITGCEVVRQPEGYCVFCKVYNFLDVEISMDVTVTVLYVKDI